MPVSDTQAQENALLRDESVMVTTRRAALCLMRTHLPHRRLLHDEIPRPILGAFYDVYNALAFGLFERVYANALSYALSQAGVRLARETAFEVLFRDRVVGVYRVDLLVEDKVLVEVKATHSLTDFDRRQVLNDLRVTRLDVGVLLHFGPKPHVERIMMGERLAYRGTAESHPGSPTLADSRTHP